MEKQGVIYKIENLVNGKVYIGQTIKSFKSRKYTHIYELRNNKKRNKKFQNAWNKYGENNFKFSIIGYFPNCELDEKEIYYIKKYNSFRNGYNMTTGGNQVMHSKNHTLNTRKKMSKISKKNWENESFKEKMMQRPIYTGGKSPRSIKVICINDNKIFSCMKEAAKFYNLTLEQISSVCTKRTKYTGLEQTNRKLQFDYYEEGKKYKLDLVNHWNEKQKVRCITTGEVYNSFLEANKETGANASSISRVCKGERNYAGKLSDGTKLVWEYA